MYGEQTNSFYFWSQHCYLASILTLLCWGKLTKKGVNKGESTSDVLICHLLSQRDLRYVLMTYRKPCMVITFMTYNLTFNMCQYQTHFPCFLSAKQHTTRALSSSVYCGAQRLLLIELPLTSYFTSNYFHVPINVFTAIVSTS